MLYIGVDLGTSACKFLLVDETGKVCNQVSREYPLSMPHTGWSEQDPSSWWQACLDGIPALLEGYATTLHYAPLPHRPRQRIQGAGGSSQGNQHRQAEYAHQGRGRCIPLGLQCDSEGNLRAYIAQGEVLPVATRSFGGIGIFAIPEMGRFYRHVLIQKRYPHHGAVAFGHYGKALFEVFKFLGIGDIAYNQPDSLPYPTENPWG